MQRPVLTSLISGSFLLFGIVYSCKSRNQSLDVSDAVGSGDSVAKTLGIEARVAQLESKIQAVLQADEQRKSTVAEVLHRTENVARHQEQLFAQANPNSPILSNQSPPNSGLALADGAAADPQGLDMEAYRRFEREMNDLVSEGRRPKVEIFGVDNWQNIFADVITVPGALQRAQSAFGTAEQETTRLTENIGTMQQRVEQINTAIRRLEQANRPEGEIYLNRAMLLDLNQRITEETTTLNRIGVRFGWLRLQRDILAKYFGFPDMLAAEYQVNVGNADREIANATELPLCAALTTSFREWDVNKSEMRAQGLYMSRQKLSFNTRNGSDLIHGPSRGFTYLIDGYFVFDYSGRRYRSDAVAISNSALPQAGRPWLTVNWNINNNRIQFSPVSSRQGGVYLFGPNGTLEVQTQDYIKNQALTQFTLKGRYATAYAARAEYCYQFEDQRVDVR